MRKKAGAALWVICVFAAGCCVWGEDTGAVFTQPTELARYEQESSSARIEVARMDGQAGIAVMFDGSDGLHYYARAETAPAGHRLKIEAKSDDFEFGEPVFPEWSFFQDPLGSRIEVYAGRFDVFVPIKAVRGPTKTTVIDKGDVEVKITGLACTGMLCLPPIEKTLRTKIDYSQVDFWKEISLETAAGAEQIVKGPSYSVWFALGLAFLAGLALNIMPCVWPVLPIIVMRIVEQAKQSRAKSIAMGLAFCFGILLFFACLAATSAILRLFYGTVLQWGDQFRNPAFVAGMALLLVALALFMFGLFTVTVPSSIAGKSGSGKGLAGAVGMGFLAAILSTPCSFGILAAAFAWAQGQRLALGTLAIMVIGVGMAVPYAILTSAPVLLSRLPRAGRWMELFKQAIGFVLLIIAVKLIAALPELRRISVLYFAVVLGFCIWMWGGWVSYNTKALRKWLIRVIAAALAVTAGWTLLPAPPDGPIDWQKYDHVLIEKHLAQKKPVLIEFTADWCLSCQVVEKTTYSNKDIARLIHDKNVLAIKADTTIKDYPATLALKNRYGEPGVPVTVVHTPDGTELHLRGLIGKNDLKKVLNNLPDAEN